MQQWNSDIYVQVSRAPVSASEMGFIQEQKRTEATETTKVLGTT